MTLTLGLTGMDPETVTALKAAFFEANERLDKRWQLVPEDEADHVVVDMDSMYGPMSWLRLHASGKNVIGLTSAQRTQTSFRLGRPFDSRQICVLLEEIERQPASPTAEDATQPVSPQPATAATVEAEVDAHVASLGEGEATPIPSGMAPAPAPQDQLPEEAIEAVNAASEPPAADPVPGVPEIPARDPMFADWLVPGALTRRARYRRNGGPILMIDPEAGIWHGPNSLKAVAPLIGGTVQSEAFEVVDDDAQWESESADAGTAQPLSRLAWLAGLVAGSGALLPEYDPEGRYALTKWPQTEREYPKHFRIATAMMKGPATVAEIAEASGMPAENVADFINANIATGFAEFVSEPAPEPDEPAKPTGLLGRLRNR